MARAPKRANFLASTRTLLAERAGYRCSQPKCDKITIGPGVRPNHSHCIGRAAHIYSASIGGPRGTGGLTHDELRSPENGIWLCADHADLVDKKRGTDYPPGLLLSYKALHEARIARELGGIYAPLGWINSLQIHSSPLFSNPENIEFGKLTLFIGENGCGKTALCEWLASVAKVQYLQRWQRIYSGRKGVNFEVSYLDPTEHLAHVSFLNQEWPRYELDNEFTAIPTAPLKVIFPGEFRFPYEEEQPNDLELIANVLGLHAYEILALCEEIPVKGTDNVTKACFQDEEDGFFLRADVKGTHPGLTFRGLSGSEQIRVLMEFSILAASRLAKSNPTALILDAGAWSLDTDWLKYYGEHLASPAFAFQTMASIPTYDLDLNELRWAGWKVIRLEGQPPNVTINTDIRTSEGGAE